MEREMSMPIALSRSSSETFSSWLLSIGSSSETGSGSENTTPFFFIVDSNFFNSFSSQEHKVWGRTNTCGVFNSTAAITFLPILVSGVSWAWVIGWSVAISYFLLSSSIGFDLERCLVLQLQVGLKFFDHLINDHQLRIATRSSLNTLMELSRMKKMLLLQRRTWIQFHVAMFIDHIGEMMWDKMKIRCDFVLLEQYHFASIPHVDFLQQHIHEPFAHQSYFCNFGWLRFQIFSSHHAVKLMEGGQGLTPCSTKIWLIREHRLNVQHRQPTKMLCQTCEDFFANIVQEMRDAPDIKRRSVVFMEALSWTNATTWAGEINWHRPNWSMIKAPSWGLFMLWAIIVKRTSFCFRHHSSGANLSRKWLRPIYLWFQDKLFFFLLKNNRSWFLQQVFNILVIKH